MHLAPAEALFDATEAVGYKIVAARTTNIIARAPFFIRR